MSVLQNIIDAQTALENMPCGSVGSSGYSLAEIEEYERQGAVIEDDADYHQAVKAWLLLEEARKELSK